MHIKDDAFASYKLLRSEFKKMDYSVSEEVIKDRRVVLFSSPTGREWKTFASQLSYPINSHRVRQISTNKEIAYEFAQEAGVSTPYTYYVSELNEIKDDEIKSLLDRYGKLIVKPANASLSKGLTLNIQSADALRAAIVRARAIAPTVLIQEQVEGEEVRFVVLNGKVVAALLRRTPRVTGDGIATVARLIERENAKRQDLRFEYITYPQLTESLVGSSFINSADILKEGEILELNRATMIKNGCSVYDVLESVDPTYVATVEGLVEKLGAKFIVTDVFLRDFTVPQQDHNHWFIEFNTSPVLKLFYGCRDGNMFDIVPQLAGAIDAWLHAK